MKNAAGGSHKHQNSGKQIGTTEDTITIANRSQAFRLFQIYHACEVAVRRDEGQQGRPLLKQTGIRDSIQPVEATLIRVKSYSSNKTPQSKYE